MSTIDYLATTPKDPKALFELSASGNKLTVTCKELDFDLAVVPTKGTIEKGVVVAAVVGLVAGGPLGALLGAAGGAPLVLAAGVAMASALKSGIRDGVVGKSETIDLGEALGLHLSVAGVRIEVALIEVKLSSWQGMLMASGQVQVS